MRKVIVGLTFVLLLVAGSAYAPCEYPRSEHDDYYQYHSTCEWNGSHWVCTEWWSLDGSCDSDCSYNYTCSGDTHVDSMTIIDSTFSDCPPICF